MASLKPFPTAPAETGADTLYAWSRYESRPMKLKNWEGSLSVIVKSAETRNVGAMVKVVAYAGIVEYDGAGQRGR